MVCGPIAFLTVYATFASASNGYDYLVHLKPQYQPHRQIWSVGTGINGSLVLPVAGGITQPGSMEHARSGGVSKERPGTSNPVRKFYISICYPLDPAAQAAS